MVIDGTTRRCQGCGGLLTGEGAICPECDWVAVPLHTTWPRYLKKWLMIQTVIAAVEAVTPRLPQKCWLKLLQRMKGRGGLKWSAVDADCYLAALKEATEWDARGQPNLMDFDTPTGDTT